MHGVLNPFQISTGRVAQEPRGELGWFLRVDASLAERPLFLREHVHALRGVVDIDVVFVGKDEFDSVPASVVLERVKQKPESVLCLACARSMAGSVSRASPP